MKYRRVSMVLTSLLLIGLIAFPATAVGQSASRYFAYELTSSAKQIITIYNLIDSPNTVTVDIYNPNGTAHSTQTVSLRAYETISIIDSKSSWGLSENDNGTPNTDYAYGMIASSTSPFSVIVAADETSELPGNGYSAIHPQGKLYADSWWNMYNYPSGKNCGSDNAEKEDYFYIFNTNSTATTVTFYAYSQSGSLVSTTSIPFAAYQVQKLYLECDLNVSSSYDEEVIGIHMTSTQVIAVNVYTNLASSFKFGDGYWDTHDNVQGGYVPWSTDDYSVEYVWENNLSSDAMAATRVTNISSSPATVTWEIYPYDGTGPNGGGIRYESTVVIQPNATIEIPLPDTDAFKNENVSSPSFHANLLKSNVPVAPIVSFKDNIDTPESPSQGLLTFWWGLRDPARLLDQIFLVNLRNSTITIHTEAWNYGGGLPEHEIGNDIVLGPFEALVTNATNTAEGPGFNSHPDKVIHFYSDSLFSVLLQEPNYGDVTPLVGGVYEPTLARIGDYVWWDENHNGLQDDNYSSDPGHGLSGVKIWLLNNLDVIIDSTLTNSDGWYNFIDIVPGTYTLMVDVSSDIFETLEYNTHDYDGIETQNTATITVSTAETNLDIDFGYSDRPLPVEISSFTAEIVSSGVRLQWTTESEDENQGFIIQRKLENEENWQEIASFLTNPGLRGQGSVTYRTDYEFLDSSVMSGFTYEYRLGDIDYNTAIIYHTNLAIRIEVNLSAIPEKFALNPAFPNPFNPITTITYNIPKTAQVQLFIYDITGNLVRKLVNNIENPGVKNIKWNGQNDQGNYVHSGMYIYRLTAGTYHESKKILLIR